MLRKGDIFSPNLVCNKQTFIKVVVINIPTGHTYEFQPTFYTISTLLLTGSKYIFLVNLIYDYQLQNRDMALVVEVVSFWKLV